MDTGLYTLIDQYCERTSAGIWNEPFNAISNMAFVIVAIWAWQISAAKANRDITEKLLIAMAGSIGVGSFLFHTFATRWAELADVLPIWSFVAVFTLVTIYRMTGHNRIKTGWIAVLATGVCLLLVQFTGQSVISDGTQQPLPLNGSLQYAPALLALIIFTVSAQLNRHKVRDSLLAATLLFLLSLVFRTVDPQYCLATNGIGTHFIWHLLNAAMIGVLLRALILHLPPATH
jgi:hypothetical protein